MGVDLSPSHPRASSPLQGKDHDGNESDYIECDTLSSTNYGIAWADGLTNRCMITPDCKAITIYYAEGNYQYCLMTVGSGSSTVNTPKGPIGSACLGVFYASESMAGMHTSPTCGLHTYQRGLCVPIKSCIVYIRCCPP